MTLEFQRLFELEVFNLYFVVKIRGKRSNAFESLTSMNWAVFQKKMNWNNFLRSVLSGSFHPISDFVADWNSQDTDLHDNTL